MNRAAFSNSPADALEDLQVLFGVNRQLGPVLQDNGVVNPPVCTLRIDPNSGWRIFAMVPWATSISGCQMVLRYQRFRTTEILRDDALKAKSRDNRPPVADRVRTNREPMRLVQRPPSQDSATPARLSSRALFLRR